MALYHVDVVADKSIADAALGWFQENSKDISGAPGFKTLNVYTDVKSEGDTQRFFILASAETVQDVENFTAVSAPKLREELGQFGDKLKVTRTITKQVL